MEISDDMPARRVMGFFAHPDDPEFFSGATFARWAAEGAAITLVLVTSGDKGSSDPDMTHQRLIEIREAEQRGAAAVLGVEDVIFLRYSDGELQPSLELRRDITRLIRLKQPDIVVTNDPTVFWWGTTGVNHPDHRAIGTATIDAVFPTARDRLNFIELARDEELDTHKVYQLYLAATASTTTEVDAHNTLKPKSPHFGNIRARSVIWRRWWNGFVPVKTPNRPRMRRVTCNSFVSLHFNVDPNFQSGQIAT